MAFRPRRLVVEPQTQGKCKLRGDLDLVADPRRDVVLIEGHVRGDREVSVMDLAQDHRGERITCPREDIPLSRDAPRLQAVEIVTTHRPGTVSGIV